MMFSVPQEPSSELWKANWQVSEVKDYKDVPSVIDWCELFHLDEGKIFNKQPFPLPLQPKDNNESLELTLQHLKRSHEWIDKALMKHGAILFRGFPIQHPGDFDAFSEAVGYENFQYVGGAAVRHNVVGNVFTTNESPPSELIPFHHEVSHSPNHPNHLLFYCEIAAKSGGETPILLSWLVYEKCVEKVPDFIHQLEEKGLKYIRYLPEEDDPSSAIGRGWKSTYLTNDKSEAERKCTQAGGTFEWVEINGEKNVMKTVSATLPAIRQDYRTGKKVFFNGTVAVFTSWQDKRNDGKKAVLFGDNSTMPPEKIHEVVSIMESIKVEFKWHPGDILVVDNKLTMHSRNFFIPPRKIYASLKK